MVGIALMEKYVFVCKNFKVTTAAAAVAALALLPLPLLLLQQQF